MIGSNRSYRANLIWFRLRLQPKYTLAMSAKLRVGWHREHFLSPLLRFADKDQGKTFELVECPGGTGEMQVKLKNGEIDVCIGEFGNGFLSGLVRRCVFMILARARLIVNVALTDALIAGLANGQTSYKLVGRYIASPLRW